METSVWATMARFRHLKRRDEAVKEAWLWGRVAAIHTKTYLRHYLPCHTIKSSVTSEVEVM